MDAIAGWNFFDTAKKKAVLEAAAKRKVEHERLYARAARAVDSAASLANTPSAKVVSSKHPDNQVDSTLTRTRTHTVGFEQLQGRSNLCLRIQQAGATIAGSVQLTR